MHDDLGGPSPRTSSPSTLDTGIRGQITGVTRFGPRAMVFGLLVVSGLFALIVFGINKHSGQQHDDGTVAASGVPDAAATPTFAEPQVSPSLAPPLSRMGLLPSVTRPTIAPSASLLPPGTQPAPSLPPANLVPNLANVDPPATAGTPDSAVVHDLVHTAQVQEEGGIQNLPQTFVRQLNSSGPLTPGTTAPNGSTQDAKQDPNSAPMLVASSGTMQVGDGTGDTGSAAPPPVLPAPQVLRTPDATQNFLSSSRQVPRSPFEIIAGSVIPAELITAIDSQLPGIIVGQVTQDVYDSRSGSYLLIPRGSRLVGVYKNSVSNGQNRVQVSWNRLIFPDTSFIDLESQAGADVQGNSGFTGKVNNHEGEIIGSALLTSIIAAGVALAQPPLAVSGVSGIPVVTQTQGQIAAQAAAQQISQVGTQLVSRGANAAPSISIPKGYPFLVTVDRDIVLPSPYQGSR